MHIYILNACTCNALISYFYYFQNLLPNLYKFITIAYINVEYDGNIKCRTGFLYTFVVTFYLLYMHICLYVHIFNIQNIHCPTCCLGFVACVLQIYFLFYSNNITQLEQFVCLLQMRC